MHHDRTGTAGEKAAYFRTGMVAVDPSVQRISFDTRSDVFEALHLGAFAIRGDGVLFEANQTLATMLGYASAEELLADPEGLWGALGDHPWWQELQERGAVHDVEVRVRRRGGSASWVCVCAVMDRPNASAFGIVKDIEQRKRTEEALRRSETRYRKIVEMSPDAVALTRFDGEFVAINARFTELFGFESVQELRALGINSKGLIIEADDDKVQASGVALQLDAPYTTLTARVRRKDRSEFLAELSASLIRDDAGEPEAFLTLIRDVSERKRVERALLESEAWLRESQRIAHLGHYVMDLTTGQWTTSESLDAILGIGDDFPKTLASWLGLVHDDDRSEFERDFEFHVFECGGAFDREYRIVRGSDGETRWVHGLGRLLPDEDGRTVRFFGTIQDVTESKHSEALRAKLEDQLRQSQKLEAVGLLAGGVTHDLNNMLLPILGNADLLLRSCTDDDDRRRLEDIREAGRRARDLLRQLMAFGCKQDLHLRPVDLNETISTFGRLLLRAVRDSTQVDFALNPLPGSVLADPGQLEQVLMNLVLNAQDAMPQGGTVTIATSRADAPCLEPIELAPPDGYVCLCVSDTGSGIPAAIKDRVFEPFFSTKAAGRGTGLGLATVYGIVRQHGGDVLVESEEGRGATFRIFLPVAAQGR